MRYPNMEKSETAPAMELFELWSIVWKKKWIIIFISFVFTVGSVVYALSLPNQYKSEAILQINSQQDNNLSSILNGQLGGLASVAGLGLSAGDDFSSVILETITSRSFLIDFIHSSNIKVPLYAAKKWDKEHDKLIWNNDIYDIESKVWTRVVDKGEKSEPSDLDTYEQVLKILQVKQDPANGLINISIEFIDPNLSKRWLNTLIVMLNEKLRKKEILYRSNSIEYLEQKVGTINNSEIKTIFYSLIEEQTKKMFLAQVQEEFALKVIDPPFLPEKKSSPKRATICILVSGLGMILAILSVLITHYVGNIRRRYNALAD